MSKLLQRTAEEIKGEGGGFSQENQAVRTGLVLVPIARILDNPYQTRMDYDPAKLVSLALDIRSLKDDLRATLGLQQVPLARIGRLDTSSGEFTPAPKLLYNDAASVRRMLAEPGVHVQLLFAHRRLRAFMVLADGIKSLYPSWKPGPDDPTVPPPDPDYAQMPLLLAHATNEAMWAHMVRENAQREQFSPIEEARAMQRAIDEFGYTYEQAAEPFGYKAKGTVGNKLRLLRLPAEVQVGLASGQISERHARELIRLEDDPKELVEAYKAQIKAGKSVVQFTEDINWRERRVKDEVERKRQLAAVQVALVGGWTPPGSQAPLPVDRLHTGEYWRLHFFDLNEGKDKALLEQGVCGSHCACCVVGWREYRFDPGSVRPDAKAAPQFCLACNDFDALLAKRRQLATVEQAAAERKEAEEKAARAAKAAALVAQAEQMWSAALAKLDLDALWADIRFWRLAGDALRFMSFGDSVKQVQTVAELRDLMLQRLLGGTFSWDSALSASVPDLKEVQRLISRLTAPLIPPAQPQPGDSQKTDWQTGWDDDDHALYGDILMEITGEECWDKIGEILDEYAELTPRVLLRLIEECPSKAGRGELWLRYNALKGGDALPE